MKRWLLKRTKVNTAEMAKELGIRQATATVLANRELYSRKDARDFLYGGEDAFGDPADNGAYLCVINRGESEYSFVADCSVAGLEPYSGTIAPVSAEIIRLA